MSLNIVILAAGKGKRMHSALPKVLHGIAGKPILEHVVNVAQKLKADKIFVIYGHQGDVVQEQLKAFPITWVEQKQQLGTGHAVLQALPFLDDTGRTLVLYGDVPLIAESTLENLLNSTPENEVGWLTAIVENPFGLGRIIRNARGTPKAIVEEKDANDIQKAIKEINTGICVFSNKYLKTWLPDLKNNNKQGEYYLTDLFAKAVEEKVKIHTSNATSMDEILGVNTKAQLAYLERVWQKNNAKKYMQAGLTLRDPNRFDVRGHLTFGQDVIIDVNVVIEGNVSLGDHCMIGPNVILRNVTIADHVTIKANSVIEDSIIDDECIIGPFARIRPKTHLKKKAKIGNFVEVKKSEIGEGTKVNHLSYIGDSIIGKKVNVGAGTITCNYDGAFKHQTVIKDNCFIGSCTQFVAPVTVGAGATIGAGSTITNDAPEGKLTIARSRQVTIESWDRPKKKE